MSRFPLFLGIVFVLTVLAILLATKPAHADKADCRPGLERSYTRLHGKVARVHGKRAPGRDIRSDGVLFRRVVFDATCGELRRSRGQLRRLARPAPYHPLLLRTSGRPAQPPAGVQSSGVRGNLPYCTWGPESGGDYNAYNPSSGARGKFQVIPSTHAAYCSDLGWSPSEQDLCAARIYQGQGPGAWVGC